MPDAWVVTCPPTEGYHGRYFMEGRIPPEEIQAVVLQALTALKERYEIQADA